MSMEFALLDTDSLSELLKLRNDRVRRRALAYAKAHGALAISAMTRYEVVRGYRDQKAYAQVARFGKFCQQAIVFPISDPVLDRAADLWVFGRQSGFPHEDADLIIAATALEYGRVLVTGNTNHFSWIPDLVLEDWRRP
jgi:tRNA(fMet)-specific endonuclease VapC